MLITTQNKHSFRNQIIYHVTGTDVGTALKTTPFKAIIENVITIQNLVRAQFLIK